MNADPARSADPAAETTALLPIRELLSYRLHRVANALSRSAALRYRREYGVSLHEWRTVALLGADEPQTVNQLARLAGLDKAQMSRVVGKLTERGLLERQPGPGRTTQLSLTRSGKSLYRGLISAANDRNAAFLACLSPDEQEVLDSALRKLAAVGRALERAEH
ncbi:MULTISPECIES: MarR family winged helix-turn-helix transcriptional regulator [Actinomadura]|uniref:MarR family transcriptional regulator n=1 Tax=Actinomadura litoris TaxID=2678616 RepID=A0A7K1L2K0_9ACTN|nr:MULTISPECIES: MarR family transcriptional regulator [Actinomadura]MBT2208969.1 MarR family transcriptional regulator [Actinomadura sp. NEAU-AAG7]MUN38466.1 MarR family transcriptional regulator [Actinomadura litoris]